MKIPALALAAALVALASSPAAAEAPVAAAMPVISARMQGDVVRVRLADGVVRAVPPLSRRVIELTAWGADGAVIGAQSYVVAKRLSYATLKTPPAMAAAHRFTVAVR